MVGNGSQPVGNASQTKFFFVLGSGPPGANSVSSVLVQRHSGADAISSKTIRHPQSSQNTTAKTTRSKSGGTSTVRIDPTPPVKVVH